MIFKEKTRLLMLPVDRILPNPSQPRKSFSEKELFGLSVSIRENGLLQPVTVRKEAGKYYLIAGERRLRASKMAGLREIPAVLSEYSGQDSAVLALLENIQRQDLNMFEQAIAMENLIKIWGISQEQAAKRLGISQSYLSNKMRLLKLDDKEREAILKSKMTERHARALLRIDDGRLRKRVILLVIKQRLNVAQTEEIIDQMSQGKVIKAEKESTIQKKQPMRTFIAKDIRIFINTIDHAVDAMKTAGIDAETERVETEEFIECTVRIPKIKSLQL